MDTEVALTVTLTVTVPLILLPSAVAAVMRAVPLATPVTVPAGSIATLAGSEVVHVTAFAHAHGRLGGRHGNGNRFGCNADGNRSLHIASVFCRRNDSDHALFDSNYKTGGVNGCL